MKKFLTLLLLVLPGAVLFSRPLIVLGPQNGVSVSNSSAQPVRMIGYSFGGATNLRLSGERVLPARSATNILPGIPASGIWWVRADFREKQQIRSVFRVFSGRQPAGALSGRVAHRPFLKEGVVRFEASGNGDAQRLSAVAGAGLSAAKQQVQGDTAVWRVVVPSISRQKQSLDLLLYDAKTGHNRIVQLTAGRWPYWRSKLTGVTVLFIAALICSAVLLAVYRKKTEDAEERRRRGGLATVLLLALLVFMTMYYLPPAGYWDEGYHISAAQKYIQGKAFMEPHPPLGKQLIALGEALFGQNGDLKLDSFVTTDKVEQYPPGYSFVGPRFFPVLLAALSAVFLYLLLFRVSGSVLISVTGSFLYLFDNAVVVHFRAAMLEGSQFFFLMWAVWYFFKIFERSPSWRQYLLLALPVGLASAVKVNGLILLLLFPVLLLDQYRDQIKEFFTRRNIREQLPLLRQMSLRTAAAIGGFLLPFCLSWYVHFVSGSSLVPGRNYAFSDSFKEIIKSGTQYNPLNFPLMLRDNLKYMADYEKKVPPLDITVPGNTGSHPAGWPFGWKPIRYRYARGESNARHLYLQGNPVNWVIGLLGVVLALILVGSRYLFRLPVTDRSLFKKIQVLLLMYAFYMYTMFGIFRVMYLYHYFIPLLFSWILAVLVFLYLYKEQWQQKNRWLRWGLVLVLLQILVVFLFFSPLTYYQPLNLLEFIQRSWFDFWGLQYAGLV